MTGNTTAHVVAKFDGNDAGLGLSIEGDARIYGADFIHLLLYPADPSIHVYASVGEVAKSGTKLVTVPGGILKFSGSASASLPKRPHETSPEFQVLFAFDTEGLDITDDVETIYNGESNVLTLNVVCHAAVKYSEYKTKAIKLLYRPKQTSVGSGAGGQAFFVEFGAISAFHPPTRSIIIFEVPISTIQEHADVEIYRITSAYVITPNGPREKPPNYPTDGIYPDMAPSLHLDVEGTVLAEVAHEVGFMTPRGSAYVRSYHQPIHEPYVGFFNYKRPRKLQPSPLGDKYPDDIRLKAKSIVAALGLGKI
jgi:hypothetical protein